MDSEIAQSRTKTVSATHFEENLGALADDEELFSKIVGVSLGSTDKIRIQAVDPQGFATAKKARTQTRKLMATVLWDMEGILLIE
jgi:hypothetical protein